MSVDPASWPMRGRGRPRSKASIEPLPIDPEGASPTISSMIRMPLDAISRFLILF
jgi:hypothetical protein